MHRLIPLVLLAVATNVSGLKAENWANWRGPSGNGGALEATPPTTWSADNNVKWKVAIPGRGSGSPIVWEDRVFVVTAVPVDGSDGAEAQTAERPPRDGDRPERGGDRRGQRRRGGGRRPRGPIPKLDFKLLCYARDTGELLWEQTAVQAKPHEGTHSTNGFASASPCTDGQHVYAHFGSRGLYCYTLDGELVWKRDDLGQMEMRHGFGEGSSPALIDNLIIVPWDHEGASKLYALDKETGESIWTTERDTPSCWSTPLIVGPAGRQQIVMNGQDFAAAYDLKSGEELWWCAGQTQRPVATPVTNGELVFVGSGHRGAFFGAFRLTGSGNIEGTSHVAWTIEEDCPDIASPLLSGDRLYFHKAKAGILSCVDADTGKPHYMAQRLQDLKNMIYASPIAAGGHVYLTDRDGTTVVIKDADQLEVVATNSVGETVDATPAAVDKELFIRGERHLFCIAQD